MTRAWRVLISVRTALVLILLLTAATFAGTTIIQLPAAIPLGSPEHAEWVEKVRPRFGSWTDVLAPLGLFHVFRSWWFQLLVAALALSSVACLVHRWQAFAREERLRARARVDAALFDRTGAVTADLAAEVGEAAEALRRVLAARGHRVLLRVREDSVQLFADRNRYARFGSLLAHGSLVLLLAAAALGSRVGWSDDIVVPEGSTRDVGVGGLAVRVPTFAAEYYPTGQPKDFRSEVILYAGGAEVARKTIRVNEPLEHDGIRFYQSFFGPSAYLRVTDAAGRVVFEDGVALAWRAQGERPVGSARLPLQDVTVYVVAPSTAGRGDALIAPGEMRLEIYEGRSDMPVLMRTVAQGAEVEAAGLRFTFVREQQFTGLRVARDPTLPLIWGSSALLVIGITAVFCFPYRRLWALVTPRPGRTSRLAILSLGARDGHSPEELASIVVEASAATRITTGGPAPVLVAVKE